MRCHPTTRAAYRVLDCGVAARRVMRHAAQTAARLGYHVEVVDAPLTQTAATAADALLDCVARAPRPACVIASGETTVEVRGAGRGGRTGRNWP